MLFEEEENYQQFLKFYERGKIDGLILHWPKECYYALEQLLTLPLEQFLRQAVEYLEKRFAILIDRLSSTQKLIWQARKTYYLSKIEPKDRVLDLEILFGPQLVSLFIETSQIVQLDGRMIADNYGETPQLTKQALACFAEAKAKQELILLAKHDLHHLQKKGCQSAELALIAQLEADLNETCVCYRMQVIHELLIEKYQLNRTLQDRLKLVTIFETYAVAYTIQASSSDACLFHVEPHPNIDRILAEIKVKIHPEAIRMGPSKWIVDRTKRVAPNPSSQSAYRWQRKVIAHS